MALPSRPPQNCPVSIRGLLTYAGPHHETEFLPCNFVPKASLWARGKIRVNTINPGLVETEGTHTANMIGSEMERTWVEQTPLGRTGQPGDIASIAVFLAFNDSGWLTGEHFLATGGLR